MGKWDMRHVTLIFFGSILIFLFIKIEFQINIEKILIFAKINKIFPFQQFPFIFIWKTFSFCPSHCIYHDDHQFKKQVIIKPTTTTINDNKWLPGFNFIYIICIFMCTNRCQLLLLYILKSLWSRLLCYENYILPHIFPHLNGKEGKKIFYFYFFSSALFQSTKKTHPESNLEK